MNGCISQRWLLSTLLSVLTSTNSKPFFAWNKCVYVSMRVSRNANETNKQAMEISHEQPVCIVFWQKSHKDKHTFMSLEPKMRKMELR